MNEEITGYTDLISVDNFPLAVSVRSIMIGLLKGSPTQVLEIKNAIASLINAAPSYKNILINYLPEIYKSAVEIIKKEKIQAAYKTIPDQCPWTLAQLLYN